jgi:DNA-binding transcriptional regulator YdaS (Cro superfamily)
MVDSSPIARAIAIAGSETKLGEGTGFSQVAINKAKRRGHASAEMARAIHWYTKGAVPGSDIRPDLWQRPEDVPPRPEGWAPSKVAEEAGP